MHSRKVKRQGGFKKATSESIRVTSSGSESFSPTPQVFGDAEISPWAASKTNTEPRASLKSSEHSSVSIQASARLSVLQINSKVIVVYNRIACRLGHNVVEDVAGTIVASFSCLLSNAYIGKQIKLVIQFGICRAFAGPANLISHIWECRSKLSRHFLASDIRIPDAVWVGVLIRHLLKAGHIATHD